MPTTLRSRRLCQLATGACLAICLLAPGSAHAEGYPPCETTATADDVEAAKGLHQAAGQYYSKEEYQQAIDKWKEAYAFDCSAHPLLINIGNAHEKLDDLKQAEAALRTYLERMGDNADPDIRTRQQAMQLALTPKPKPVVKPKPVPVPVTPPPVEQDDEGASSPTGAYVLLGLGSAVAVGGGVLLGLGLSDISAAKENCDDDRNNCTPAAADQGNRGRTMAPVGGIVAGVGAATAIGGLIWLLTADDDSDVQPQMSLGPGQATFGLSGRF